MEDFGGETDSTYPTQFGLLNTGGSGQLGDYSNPTADSLINQSDLGPQPGGGHERGCRSSTTSLPVLWQPVARPRLRRGRRSISATTPEAFENLTQYTATPEFWYLTK